MPRQTRQARQTRQKRESGPGPSSQWKPRSGPVHAGNKAAVSVWREGHCYGSVLTKFGGKYVSTSACREWI
jgi:hypothetical protein